MATAAEYGFHTPSGTDQIRNGDDEITFNAERTAYWFDKLRFDRGTIPAGTDLNTLVVPGMYYTGGVENVATLQNLGNNYPSAIYVAGNGGGVVSQIQLPYNVQVSMLFRATGATSIYPTGWTPWQDSSGWDRGALPAGTNVYDMRGEDWAGVWSVDGGTLAGSIQGTPPPGMAAWLPGQFEVKGSVAGSTNLSTIIYTPYAPGVTTQQIWTTTIKLYSQTGEAAWAPWTNLIQSDQGGGDSGAAVNWAAPAGSHFLMEKLFRDAYPEVSTGNKGAVVIRLDHGWDVIRDSLIAILRQYNLPVYVAANSEGANAPEAVGVTWAEIKAWMANDRLTIGGHSYDHKDRNTAEGIYQAIVEDKNLLETRSGQPVWGFTVPGLSEYNKFEGFGGGGIKGYTQTLAGGLILANYAVCSGTIGNLHRTLDGTNPIGSRHIGFEKISGTNSRPWTALKAEIDAAVANKTALTIMAHPYTLGMTDHWDTAYAHQVFGYIRTLIDAGQLADIDYYQSHNATL